MHTTDDLLQEIAKLREEVRHLRAAVTGPPPGPGSETAPTIKNRRQLLTLAAAGVGGAGLAALAPAAPAAAGNGEALIIGNGGGQNCSTSTGVAVTGNVAPYGFAFTDNGVGSISPPSALVGHARGFGSGNFSTGVLGVAEESAFYGVYGDSVRCGVRGVARGPADNGWPGVLGENFNGVGIRGAGGTDGVVGVGTTAGVRGETDSRTAPALRAARRSGLLALDDVQPAPPTRGTYRSGDIINDRDGSGVWACVTAGTPGAWRKVAGTATAGAFHAIVGGRAYDSRTAGAGGRITGGTSRVITIPTSLVPDGSQAISFQLTVRDTAGSGGLTVYPAGRARPTVQSAIWWAAGQSHVVGGVTALGSSRRVRVHCAGGSTHLTLDVTGYYL
jgi:hypothetical protein